MSRYSKIRKELVDIAIQKKYKAVDKGGKIEA